MCDVDQARVRRALQHLTFYGTDIAVTGAEVTKQRDDARGQTVYARLRCGLGVPCDGTPCSLDRFKKMIHPGIVRFFGDFGQAHCQGALQV